MIHARCISTELLLERKAPALSHAERLRVETHLADCERCRREHAAMIDLLDMVEQKVAASVKSNVQERAIARAMLRSRDETAIDFAPRPLAPARAMPRLVWGLAIAGIAGVLAIGISRPPSSASGAGSTSSSSASMGDRLIDGSFAFAGIKLAAGAAIPPHTELHPNGGAFKATLAHARLSVQGAESFAWSPEDRVVSLRGGVADVSVDPAPHRSFRVTTPRFSVNVVGTEFQVSADRVGVTRGRVRVVSPSGELWAELGPGQSWNYTAPVAHDLVASRAPASPDSTQVTPAAAPSDPRAEPKATSSSLPATELLVRARHRLASGDARAALTDLNAALAAGASRSQQAEAYTLKGDCALVEGDPRAAVRQYLDVSRRFSDLRAGETALFAAARTEGNGGRQASAKKLLQTYRERYPAGQFKREVEARLRILEAE